MIVDNKAFPRTEGSAGRQRFCNYLEKKLHRGMEAGHWTMRVPASDFGPV